MKTLVKIFAAFIVLTFVTNTTFAQKGSKTCDGTAISAQLHDGSGSGSASGSGSGLQGNDNGIKDQIKEISGEYADIIATLTEEQQAIIYELGVEFKAEMDLLLAVLKATKNPLEKIAIRIEMQALKEAHRAEVEALLEEWGY